MSWSVQAVGKPAAVAAKLESLFSAPPQCQEPEETIKKKVAETIAVALAAFPPGMAVTVSASGSQSTTKDGTQNTLNVKLEPIFGFVE